MLTEEHMARSVGGQSNPQHPSQILESLQPLYLRLPVVSTSQVTGLDEEMIVHKVVGDLPKGKP